MSLPFTQFLMPDGRQSSVSIDRPTVIEANGQMLIEAGYAFEIEMLMNGVISMEIIRRGAGSQEDDILASELCENGPQVPVSVDKMINAAINELDARGILSEA